MTDQLNRGHHRTTTPVDHLENRVVNALVTRGLLVPRARIVRHRLLTAAAVVAASTVLFLGGMLVGSRGRPATAGTAATPRFVLLLYEDSAFVTPPGREAALVEEYRGWARSTVRGGRITGGTKLKDRAQVVEPSVGGASVEVPAIPRGGEHLAGYFILETKTYESAVEIAKTCPHLRYGGRIVIREVEIG